MPQTRKVCLFGLWDALKQVKDRWSVLYSRSGRLTPPHQVLSVSSRQLPRLLHELSILLGVEHLCSMVLLDVRPSPTLISQLLRFQHLRHHSEGWSEAFPNVFPGCILALFLVEEFRDGKRPASSGNVTRNLRELRRRSFRCWNVQVHDQLLN